MTYRPGSGPDMDSPNLGARATGCFTGLGVVILLAILSKFGWMPWWVPLIVLVALIVVIVIIAWRDKT